MGEVLIAPERPDSADARGCLEAYAGELRDRFGFSLSDSTPMESSDMVPPAGILLLARRAGEPIGCCALKIHGPDLGEVKRLWIRKDARGHGLGRRMLASIEEDARSRGLARLRLDTHGSLAEARSLYVRHGYVEIDAFNDNRYAEHWYEKTLTPLG
jgi:ribosomal protein S18 acetylase RimI-like enzyme